MLSYKLLNQYTDINDFIYYSCQLLSLTYSVSQTSNTHNIYLNHKIYQEGISILVLLLQNLDWEPT